MNCKTCVYQNYCADMGVNVDEKEGCFQYVPICESCRISYDETREDN